MQNEHKDIIGLFQSFHSGYRLSEVFGDFIEVATIALINRFTFDGDWEQREERYHEIRKKYTEAEFRKMAEILAKLVEKFIKAGQCGTYGDILGEIYMLLDLGSQSQNQYFTPFYICRMMAQIVGEGLADKLEGNPFVSIMEPSCGSGANIIAFAETIRLKGFDHLQKMAAVAIDIDICCARMCFIQCELLGIPAKIIHGNALTGELWTAFRTSHWLYGDFEQMMRADIKRQQTDPSPSSPMTLEEQLVLF